MHGPLPEVTQSTTVYIKFVPPVSGRRRRLKHKQVPCVFQLQSSSLRVPDAALWRPPLAFTCFTHDINLRKIFECAHFKFTVSCRSMHSCIHTRMRNAVTLVWGSLRLAPMKTAVHMYTYMYHCLDLHWGIVI